MDVFQGIYGAAEVQRRGFDGGTGRGARMAWLQGILLLTFAALCRKAHGNDPRRDVRKVQIKAILLIATLVL